MELVRVVAPSVLQRHCFPVHRPPQKRLLTSSVLWSPVRGKSCPRPLSTSVCRPRVLICVSRASTRLLSVNIDM